ncbi:MAG: hypothetical protein HQL90_04290 [Magnetococcales bacterium]|nr:hypothetical protein [Magnetococcales bacterium]
MAITSAMAILAGAAIAGGASIYAANKAASAQEDAAMAGIDATKSNTLASIAEQRRQFDATKAMLEKQQALAVPFVQAGTQATGKLQQYLTGGAAGQEEFSKALRATPGYGFLQEEAQIGAERGLARSGLSQSGRAAEELQRRRMGLADTTAQGYMANLFNLAGYGTQGLGLGNANASQIAQAGQSSANQIGSALQNLGINQANMLQNAGQARASSYLSQGQEVTGLLGALARSGIGQNSDVFSGSTLGGGMSTRLSSWS